MLENNQHCWGPGSQRGELFIRTRSTKPLQRGRAVCNGQKSGFCVNNRRNTMLFDLLKRVAGYFTGQPLFHSHGCFLAPSWDIGWNQDTIHEREESQTSVHGINCPSPPSTVPITRGIREGEWEEKVVNTRHSPRCGEFCRLMFQWNSPDEGKKWAGTLLPLE